MKFVDGNFGDHEAVNADTPAAGPRRRQRRCAVILAGGEGSRLRSLTRAICGDERPKQFCPVLGGGDTLLGITRRRVGRAFHEGDVFYSLTAKHRRFFTDELGAPDSSTSSRLVVQPSNKGTAPAILYALLRVAAERGGDATVVFFPSDHYFSDEEALMAHVDAACLAVESGRAPIVLLGIEPDRAERSYGWIEPSDSLFAGLPSEIAGVRRFWEKPDAAVAERLLARGCLWNSFIMAGRVSTLLGLFERLLPAMHREFAAASASGGALSEAAAMSRVYARTKETNFSTSVLEPSSEMLYVRRVGDVVWNDLGEPERVRQTLGEIAAAAATAASPRSWALG